MTEIPRQDLELTGCTPDPLMAYLKALGILRLVSEQKDEDARGWWRNDVFHLRSTLDRDALVKFFRDEYKPTPIVAPWAGGSGFFSNDNKTAVEALTKGNSLRVDPYVRLISNVRAIIKDEEISDKPSDQDKVRLIRRYRRELPDEVVTWIDAAMVLREDGQAFAPLLGTGGNDGRLDFTQNFMQRIVSLGLQKDDPASGKSHAWLEQALFATLVTLDRASVGQFAPGRAGGPNATQGMEGESADNPWDFILMIEGALLFAGKAMRRFGLDKTPRAAFPFTVRAMAAGFDSPSLKDEMDSRGELWVPLWTRPTTSGELRQLFGEGRAEVSGQHVRDGADFARAVAGLGVDRGISGFNRVGFLKRSGKAFLAAPLGRFEVAERAGVHLLREVDPWLQLFRSASTSKDAPACFASALRRIESTIFNFCKYGEATFFQEILVALGAAERELATAKQFTDKHKLRPLAGLSSAWAEAADDKSAEFAIARALASVYDPEEKIGPLRANLEPVDWENRCRLWAERDRAVVWNAADLIANLASVLQRRVKDGERVGCNRLPVAARFAVPLDTVAMFLSGKLDSHRIGDLIWGLMLVRDGSNPKRYRHETSDVSLPQAYALLKLLFLPLPIVIEGSIGRGIHARLLREDQKGGIVIHPEPSILPLLRSGRLGEACTISMRRLRASGLDPMPKPIRGRRVRDDDWRELDRISASIDPRRLAASLLIPISDDAVAVLVALVISSYNMKDRQIEMTI